MSRRDRHLIAFTVVATIVCAAYWALWVVDASSSALALALFFHVTCATAGAALVSPRRRALALALGLVLPVFGPLAAAVSMLVAGRPGADLVHDPHAVVHKTSGLEIARRLTESLPACEALVSTDTEARRQALSKLKARAAREDISTLRWARTQRHADAAVEVALAFEEISARFEHAATTARAAIKTSPSYESSAALFEILTGGITSGVVDAPLVMRLAAEACRQHDAAVHHDPIRGASLLAKRARLELAMHRPNEALALLSGKPLDLRSHPDLAQLYFEAAYAARRFDLVPRTSRAVR
jgi:hypothetical protein